MRIKWIIFSALLIVGSGQGWATEGDPPPNTGQKLSATVLSLESLLYLGTSTGGNASGSASSAGDGVVRTISSMENERILKILLVREDAHQFLRGENATDALLDSVEMIYEQNNRQFSAQAYFWNFEEVVEGIANYEN